MKGQECVTNMFCRIQCHMKIFSISGSLSQAFIMGMGAGRFFDDNKSQVYNNSEWANLWSNCIPWHRPLFPPLSARKWWDHMYFIYPPHVQVVIILDCEPLCINSCAIYV